MELQAVTSELHTSPVSRPDVSSTTATGSGNSLPANPARGHVGRAACPGRRARHWSGSCRPVRSARQRGVVLFLSLVVLLVLTVLGVSGAQVSMLEERMAGGARDRDIAFQAAEAALARGEVFVTGLSDADLAQFAANEDGMYRPRGGTDDDWWNTVDWAGDDDLPTVAIDINGVSAQPRYIVEYMRRVLASGDSFAVSNVGAAAAAPTDIFRITAYGWGGSTRGVVMLQATVGVVLN